MTSQDKRLKMKLLTTLTIHNLPFFCNLLKIPFHKKPIPTDYEKTLLPNFFRLRFML